MSDLATTPRGATPEAPPASASCAREYNYEHFRAAHVLEEVGRLLRGAGALPGATRWVG